VSGVPLPTLVGSRRPPQAGVASPSFKRAGCLRRIIVKGLVGVNQTNIILTGFIPTVIPHS